MGSLEDANQTVSFVFDIHTISETDSVEFLIPDTGDLDPESWQTWNLSPGEQIMFASLISESGDEPFLGVSIDISAYENSARFSVTVSGRSDFCPIQGISSTNGQSFVLESIVFQWN